MSSVYRFSTSKMTLGTGALKRGVAYYMGYLYNNLYFMSYTKKGLNEAYGSELFISCQIG